MIEELINDHIEVSNSLLNDVELIDRLCKVALSTILSKNKILLCGNGGSASDASHIAAEFIGKFQNDRRPLPAISLSDNLSSITSISNDYNLRKFFLDKLKLLELRMIY